MHLDLKFHDHFWLRLIFTRENDYLVDLIEEYGFNKVSIINRPWTDIPEDLFLKKIIIKEEDIFIM
jgi:hypothetical protein